MSDPLKTLDIIINERRNCVSQVNSQIELMMKRNNRETLAFLEPIFEILKDIQDRLSVLEKIELKKID